MKTTANTRETASQGKYDAALLLGATAILAVFAIFAMPLARESLSTSSTATYLPAFLYALLPAWITIWCVMAWAFWDRPLPGGKIVQWLFAVAGAVLFFSAFLPPVFSDDIYRYSWEGQVTASGANPYSSAPESPELEALRAANPDLNNRVNNAHLAAIYPALPQLIFAFIAFCGGGAKVWKILAVAIFLGGVLPLTHRWMKATGIPTGRLLLLAFHPLVFIEIGLAGHLDVLVMLGAVAMLAMTTGGDSPTFKKRAGALAGLMTATMAKLAPIVMLPHLLLTTRDCNESRRAFLMRGFLSAAAVLAVCALLYVPFASAGDALFSSLGIYQKIWAHNGSVYALLEKFFFLVDPNGGFWNGALSLGGDSFRDRVLAVPAYESQHANQFGARAIAGLAFVVVWAAALWKRLPFDAAWLAVVGAGLLLSPVVHPWYLLAILPVAFRGGAMAGAALWWSFAILFTYAVLGPWWSEGRWNVPAWTWWLQYAGMLGAAIFLTWRKKDQPRRAVRLRRD